MLWISRVGTIAAVLVSLFPTQDLWKPDIYDLRSGSLHVRAVINRKEINGDRKVILTTSALTSFRQALWIPPPWCFFSRLPDDPASSDPFYSRPSAGLIRCEGKPILWLRFIAQTGVYDYGGLIFYRLNGRSWERVPYVKDKHLRMTDKQFRVSTVEVGRGRVPSCSNRGAFCLKGPRLYIWNFIYEPEKMAHSDPAHYELNECVLRPDKVVLVSHRETKGKYLQWDNLKSSLPPASEDPLREFGLRWQW